MKQLKICTTRKNPSTPLLSSAEGCVFYKAENRFLNKIINNVKVNSVEFQKKLNF